MTNRVMVLPALRVPEEDRKAVGAVLRCIGALQPDEIVMVGDAVAGAAADWPIALERFFEPLRTVYSGPIGFHVRDPGGLDEAPEDLNRLGVTVLPEHYHVAQGWVTTHGFHSGSTSQIAGNTALNVAKKLGVSVVLGHTHRAGIGSYTYGYGGEKKNERTVTGMEVGNLMNMKLAGYLKGGTGNWQQGFGLLTVDGQHVKPEVVPITRGKFTVDGSTWSL